MQRMWQKGRSGLLLAVGLILNGCGGGESETPAPEPVKQYSVQLSVSNLQGTLGLQLNGQSSLSVTKDGSYTFDATLTKGSSYSVTVATQPGYQQCTVSSGTGTVQSSNVTNITVACVDQVQMTELATYYPASVVTFGVPVASTDPLSVTYNGVPLKVEQGQQGTRVVLLPNNASGAGELAYSVGTLSRKKAITVQPLTLPSDTKTFIDSQYQTILDGIQQERDAAADPASYDALLAELKKNQAQLATLSAEDQKTLAIFLLQLTQQAQASEQMFAAAGTSCVDFADAFNKKLVATSILLYASIEIAVVANPLFTTIGLLGFALTVQEFAHQIKRLYNDGTSCIQLIAVAVIEATQGVAIVKGENAANYTQSAAAALMKTGSTYRYTLKPEYGFDALIASTLGSITSKLRSKLQFFPDFVAKPISNILDPIEKPTPSNVTYQVTADPIAGVSMGITVEGDKLTVAPKISDIAQLTQSSYPTKLHIKASVGDKAVDVDASVVVDFKPVVQNSKMQAEIGKKTTGKVMAENVTSFAVVTQPTLGVLNFDSKTGAFDYTPNADTVGKTDSFTVRGTYLLGGDPNKSYVSELATITVDIGPESFCEYELHPGFEQNSRAPYMYYVCYYDREKTKRKAEYYHYPAPKGYSDFNADNRFGTYLQIYSESPLPVIGNSPIESYRESIDLKGIYTIKKLDRAVWRTSSIYRTESVFTGGVSGVSFSERLFESDSTDETIVYRVFWNTSDESPSIDGYYSGISWNKTETECEYQRTALGSNWDPDRFVNFVMTKRPVEGETKKETRYESCPRSPKPERDLIKEKLAPVKEMYKLRFPDTP